MDEDLRAAMQMSMQGLESMQEVESKGVEADATVNETESVPFGPGIPSEFTGMYELFAVVTHKGRSADSGHYMGWARQAGDQWVVFDDDEVSECTTENVMDLKGGGDYHMAYLIFYRFKMQELK
jgi:ubiquitin carboxyl-terminal hydrolase 14